jgi:hypothetical protein
MLVVPKLDFLTYVKHSVRVVHFHVSNVTEMQRITRYCVFGKVKNDRFVHVVPDPRKSTGRTWEVFVRVPTSVVVASFRV